MRSRSFPIVLLIACSALATGCPDPAPSGDTEASSGETGSSSGTTAPTPTPVTATSTSEGSSSTTDAEGSSTTTGPDPDGTTGSTTDATTETTTDAGPDRDDDGYPASEDCDDDDPQVHPGADERCNGIDDDCDATTPEDGVVSVDGQGSFFTIDAAIAAASPGAEVRVCPGTFVESITIEHDLRLVAQEDAESTIIDGNAAGPTVRVLAGEVALVGLTLTGGSSVGFGGGLSVTGTDPVTVEQCAITSNVSSDGAGIYASTGAQLVLLQTTISGNTGGIGGGLAMQSNGAGSLSMTDCTIADNFADELGGGMVLVGVPMVEIASSAIIDNDALDGGGLAIDGSAVTLTDGTVQRNIATGTGGGVLLFSGTGLLTSVASELGTGADDNVPHDVAVPGVGTFTGYGAAASFVCDATGCS